MANDPTQTQEAAAAHGTLVNGQFTEKAAVGGAIGWTPESHGIWKEEDGVRYIHLLPGKHINQQPTVDPAWRQVQLKTRIRIPEIHPGATERDAAGFRLRFEDAQGKVFQPTPHWMFRETTDGWQEVAKTLEVPPRAIRLKMTVAIYCEGQMDVDYIRLEAVEEGGDSNE